ncbi:probable G-protein coupled receptor 179 isoform X2 [Strigops habroptila]|uniref:probable G-protein coupled receptor 179 isoform X2 n=1 Tax=Strigops habroptila TaxID=2489341 RepID=UPI0011D00435|nr:probable G-protein coupled receptor 179 isoform X2 [Strigops habroptila]
MGPWRWLLLWCWHTALLHGQHPQDSPVQPAGWSPAPSPSWVPTAGPGAPGDTEGSAAALAFLQTGDAQRLARANCSRGVPAGAAGPGPPPALRAALRAVPEALAHAANFLNMLFQTNDIREASVAEDVEWYQALVRSLAEGHPWVRRVVLALDAHPLAAKPLLMLQATKEDGQILLQDVSAAAPSLGNLSWDNEWFNALKSQRTPVLRKRVLSNDLHSMDTPKWQRGDSYVGDPSHVRWSPPFLECRDGRFLPAWAVTLSSAFYGLKPDLSPEFKGVVRVDIELRDVAIDQCASGPGWFADTHRCDLNSTQCIPQESHGFVLGRYQCRCKPGFYGASGAASGAQAGTAGAEAGALLGCRPCRQGCSTCEDDAPCLIQEDRALRAAVLSCQACCMLAIFLSMLVSYRFRRSKRIRASGIILLETILFGSLLLYFPVFILYFKPSIFRCIVLRWVRMLGFTIVYGTITLKLYRVLKVFLSRTAQRVPCVSSGRVLKMLGLILVLVLWFLAAWTIGMLENVDKNIPLVIRTQTARGLHFYICGHDHWDYMMVIAEMLFLLWGSFLCYTTRTVPSAFHEPRYMGIALHNELMISATFHVVRFIMVPSLHPDWTLLLFFAHTHSTITMTLALLFIPKFLHTGSPLREEITAEVYEDELDMRHSGSCLNSSIASAWSEHSLDPDDIREELKKLYRQLEVQRTWRMVAHNPHLPKQRSSRRSLARSIARRVTELPEALARRRSSRSSPATQLLDAGTTNARMRDDGSRSTEGSWGGSPILLLPREPAPGRKMMVATASEQSDSESLDAAPLVCKSASAHNLVGDGQLPLPHAPLLHKSLSVAAGGQDEALLAASRAAWGKQHAEHPFTPALGHPTAQGSPKEAGKPQSPGADAVPSPAEGCSQDVSPLGDGKVQKHVTYAPIKSISVDGSHHPGRVRRVVVRRTPPRPPIRYQSLGQHGPAAGDSLGAAEPPTGPPARVGEPAGTAAGMEEEDPGCASPSAGKGPAVPIPAQVCPWELVQEEILSRREKATKAAESGTTGDTAAIPPSTKPSAQKTSLRSLGLAVKAFNRSRGKSILKGKREGEGSLRKRGHEQEGGSRRERPSLAKASAVSFAGTTGPEQDFSQHNNSTAGWGDSPALGTGDGEELAEEPGAPHGGADAAHKVPPSAGHQEGAERPREPPVVVAQPQPQRGDEAAVVELGNDAPAATPKEGLEETSRSIPSQDHAEVEQPHAGPIASSSHPSSSDVQRAAAEKLEAEVCPQGALDVPAGAMCHEEVAAQEDTRIPPAKVLEKGSSQPEPLGPRDSEMVPARSQSKELAPAGRQAQGCPRETQADSSIETGICPWEESGGDPQHPREELGMEKPPATPSERLEGPLEGRKVEVCPWETPEQGRTMRAETCPWDMEGAQPEQGGQEGERTRVVKWGKSIRSNSLGLVGAPKPPNPAASSSELPEGTPRSARALVCPWEVVGADSGAEGIRPWERVAAVSNARKTEDGDISQGKNGISPQAAAPGGTGGMGLAADKGSTQQGCPYPGEGAEQPSTGLAAGHSALPKASSKRAGPISSSKANIRPWEVEDEPLAKAEICPWEEPAAPLGKDRASQDTRGTSKGENKPATRGLERIKPKLAEMGAHQPEHRNTKIFANLIRKSLESSKAKSKKSQSMESIKEEVCPWESLGTEQPMEQPRARNPALPKAPPDTLGIQRTSQSGESLKAEVCPWEAPGAQSMDKAEICPWEVAAAPSGKEESRQDKDGLSIGSRSSSTSEGAFKEIGHSTPAEEKASEESLKAEVCPWEAPEAQSMDKAEICPWEVAAAPSAKEESRQDKDGLSIGSRSPSTSEGVCRETGHSTPTEEKASAESLKAEVCPWEAPEAQSMDKAEMCPWEVAAAPTSKEESRQDKDGLSIGSRSSSTGEGVCRETGHSTHTEEKASTESLKAEVCPWEAPGAQSMDKAEICPWEAAAAPSGKEESRQDKDGLSIGRKSPSTSEGAFKKIGHSTPAEEKASGESLKAEVCPWEAPGAQSMDKAEICPWEVAAAPTSKEASRQDKDGLSIGSRSSSTREGAFKEIGHSTPTEEKASGESLKAEVCPWEAPGAQSMGKAEICPWEVAAAPSGKEESRQDKDGLSIGRKSPSTGEGVCRETGHSTPAEEKASAESLKGEVCPWEAPGAQSTDKAEICPWEAAAAPSAKEESRQDKDGLSIGSRSSSTSEGVCRETGHSTPAEEKASAESLKAEVCPWEAPGAQSMDKAEMCPWEAAAAPSQQLRAKQGPGGVPRGDKRIRRQAALPSLGTALERGSSEREAACPWESLDMGQPMEQPRARSPALPRAPPRTSQSGESLKAEVCPWEAPGAQSTDKAEICPWEVAAAPSAKEESRQDKDSLSIGSKSPSTSEGVCRETGHSTPAEEKASMESLKAEVCPWEAPGAQSIDKAEICPWEVAAAPSKSLPSEAAGACKPGEKGSSEREAICPWESLDMEEQSLKTATGKGPSKKSDSTESRKAEICPWEAAEPNGTEEESPQGADGASSTGMGEAKPVVGASPMSPAAPQSKPKGRPGSEAKHKPLSRIQPPRGPRAELLPWDMGTAPGAGSSPSPAEVCPWEAEEAPPASDKTSTDMRKTSEVCPWGVEGADATRSGTKAGVCPWDHE